MAAERAKAEAALPFWRTKTLAEMTKEEWESLCDGCAKCCLIKLEDEVSGEISFTNVACRLLDIEHCRCTRYDLREKLVEECTVLSVEGIGEIPWLPSTCAYRLVAEGKDLFDWHPLVSGDPMSVHRAGISARGRIVSERQAGELEDYVVDWPK